MKKILYIFLFALTIHADFANAQTITIGSGTQTNGYNEASPVNITRDRSVSWTVYTVAELNAAGISGAATINRMGYFVTNIPVNTIPGYTISMKHTNAANAGSNPGNNGYTEVKSAFTYSPNQGLWDMLDLDTPFDWNGTQNICVKVCWSTANNDPSGQLRTYNATNGYRYRWTNNGNGSYCGSNPNTNRQWKPQIRFIFETETIWTGTNGTNWFDSGNWTANVPNSTMDARIPIGTANEPNLTGLGECANLTLEGGMTLSASGSLNVYGDFINTGTYTDAGGQTTLTGEGPNNITNSVALEISNLIVESKFGATINGSAVTITKELQVNKSALNTNDLIIMKSDAIGTARIDELTTNCFYELIMDDAWGDGWNGGNLTVLEDGVPIGVYQSYGSSFTEIIPVGNGTTLQLVYASGQFENENTYTLNDPNGTPIFSDGPNPTVGTVFTTTATCGFTDPISGDISMERYIDAGETFWRYMSSAVQGATLDQFNDDFATAGYPGSWYPTFEWISAYNYDETQPPTMGYQATTGSAQTIGIGEGWQIWCGDTITGTQPFVFDLVGLANQGDITMPVTYTPSGTPSEDGWNLVGNPYPSTIDWDDAAWTKTNMANAVYIQNPDNQQYATYVAGASTNGGSRYIPSQQAFWVQATGGSPVLTAREGVKSNVDQAYFKNGNDMNPGMTIRVQGVENFDEAVLRHLDGSVDEFEYLFDAEKLWGGWGVQPQITLINNEVKDLTVHSFDKGTQEWSIPMRVIVFESGDYNLEFENLSELNVLCIQIEDTYDGSFYMVEDGQPLTFELSDTTYAPRFLIHLGKTYETSSLMASCHGLSDGAISLDLQDSSPLDYEITFEGTTTFANATADPLMIENLESGIYTIEVPALTNLCNQTTFNVVVNEPSIITASANVSDELLGADGAIVLDVIGGTPPYEYTWQTGELGQSVTSLVAGTYLVQIQDANGCETSLSPTVNSQLGIDENESPLEAFYNNIDNQITFSSVEGIELNQFVLYNDLGQIVQTFAQGAAQNQTLQIDSSLGSGVYVLKDLQSKFRIKFVK
jgi:hypothetical protein